jgi:regulator of ribonuclease activity A
MIATADILDEHGERALVCPLPLRSFGGRPAFSGEVSTVRCFEDNVVLKRRLGEPGEGHVLVVDGGGSLRVALVGDMIGALARDSGWPAS